MLFSGLSPAGVELCVRKLTIVLPLRMIQEQTGALPLLLPMESLNYSCQLFRIVFDRQIHLHINFIALVDLVKQVSYLDTNKTVLCCDDALFFFYVTHVLSDQQICLCLQSFKCWDNSVCVGSIKVYLDFYGCKLHSKFQIEGKEALHCTAKVRSLLRSCTIGVIIRI